MPLYWTINSKERVFTGVGEGAVTLADAVSLLEALAGAGALTYRKLFDGRAVQSTMTGDELMALCVKIRSYHDQGPIGALAVVCTDEQSVAFGRLLGALAAADRPIKLFTTPRRASNWLDQQPAATIERPAVVRSRPGLQLPRDIPADGAPDELSS